METALHRPPSILLCSRRPEAAMPTMRQLGLERWLAAMVTSENHPIVVD